MSQQRASTGSRAAEDRLDGILARLAAFLPSQGPIGIFIHHNTLHAFEDLDFEEAVVSAGRRLSCEPFLPEEHYRAAFRTGRITQEDLGWALDEDLGPEGGAFVIEGLTRRELRFRIARHGIPSAAGASLTWLLQETSVLRGTAARALWKACQKAGQAIAATPPAGCDEGSPRHRDLLLAATGQDTDAWVHPVLIRIVGAFLDQGLAHWSLPQRRRGLYACFLDLYSHPWASLCGGWAGGLPAAVSEEKGLGLTPKASLKRSLALLGVPPEEWPSYLEATALALRGWADIVRQLEERPDRVPAISLPSSLAEFLAVRLILERVALAHAVRRMPGGLADLRSPASAPPGASALEHAWKLFHAARLCGLTADAVQRLAASESAALLSELERFDGIAVRRVLQAAYERHLRSGLCDALAAHAPAPVPERPDFQAIFCLDEREESFRRHLEEAAPEVETLGAAGFFGVAMYFQGATDAHPRPLCPIAVTPKHYVGEVKLQPESAHVRWRRVRRRGSGQLSRFLHRFSAGAAGGYLASTVAGPLSLAPLMLRVVFPGMFRRWSRALPLSRVPPTRLLLDRRPQAPPLGEYSGFSKEEMAAIVAGLLRGAGVAERLSPLVVVVGHGSTSLNNPHESAHDCGACGGGRGGPNARAFAQMANDPAVRALLAAQGLRLDEETWFVGAQRNTCDNSVEFYDLDLMPAGQGERFRRVRASFERARRAEARERCRRFDSFPSAGGPAAALSHVEARAHDLAQPRPEYGHATNAYCIVGRRARTRGLFLDRRAFLVSYDPQKDADGSVLERTLAAVVPVVAGISLEYYFSRVDPTGYGCGTKLPHNVACLMGVMDGAQSDLRTGLPWQMVEIHEPVRLFLVIECGRERFERVLERLPELSRLLQGRWLFAACLDPGSSSLWLREGAAWRPWSAQCALPVVRGDSAAWYTGHRGPLPIAEILGAAREGANP